MKLEIKSDWCKVALGIVAIGTGFYIGSKLLCGGKNTDAEKPNIGNNESEIKVSLMEHEQEIMAMMPAVSTITRYSSTGADLETYLREKVTEIILRNPWLTGRLHKYSNEGMYLSYDPSIPSASKAAVDAVVAMHFRVEDNFELPEGLSFDELVTRFIHFQVNKGNDCANKPDEVLFKVCLVKIRDSKDVVLVFSLSHVLGDGYTFYTLHTMLDRSTPVTSLEVVRHTDFKSQLGVLLGQKYVDWIHSPLVLIGLIACSIFRGPMQLYVVEVDNAWIDKQKKEFLERKKTQIGIDLEQGGFASTNDILTAWHNKHCRSDFALMACNLRNRVYTYTAKMAGNYENSIVYNKHDGHTPEAVRQSLSTFRNASNTMPNMFQTLLWNGSLTTNWSSFYKQIDLSDASTGVHCVHIAHIPIVLSADVLVWRECLISFKLDANRTGLLIATRSMKKEFLDSCGIGRVISTF